MKRNIDLQISEKELQVLRSLIEHEREILSLLKEKDKKKIKFKNAIEIVSDLSSKLSLK